MSPELALTLKRAADLLLLPPAGPLWLVVLGLCFGTRRAGQALAALGVIAALAFSTAGVGRWLIAPLEHAAGEPLDEPALRALMARADAPRAIVILGGGYRGDLRERPERYRPHPRTVERVVHGAWVARVTGLPVLVSGGAPPQVGDSEAAMMKRLLETRLGTPVRWVESASRDTAGNARGSAALLLAEKRRRVLLVTHAAHMPRARAAFVKAGFDPVPVPLGYYGTPPDTGWEDWLPSAYGVSVNWLAAHEIAGRLWYRLRDLI
ncbi:MAG: YdcF family protein [Burkholderiaceae bacterium]|nr:YdcF family protein [Burkholderiaceae bacterium]